EPHLVALLHFDHVRLELEPGGRDVERLDFGSGGRAEAPDARRHRERPADEARQDHEPCPWAAEPTASLRIRSFHASPLERPPGRNVTPSRGQVLCRRPEAGKRGKAGVGMSRAYVARKRLRGPKRPRFSRYGTWTGSS